MPKQFYDPITKRFIAIERIDLTASAYLQRSAPNAYVEELGEAVAQLQRRGA